MATAAMGIGSAVGVAACGEDRGGVDVEAAGTGTAASGTDTATAPTTVETTGTTTAP